MLFLLQFQLIPIRDWNAKGIIAQKQKLLIRLQFQLIPIRDWNVTQLQRTLRSEILLQFQLIPIRDWNPLSSLLFALCYVAISINPY